MIQKFIIWLIEALLGRAVNNAVSKVQDLATEKIEDKNVGEINAENVVKYEKAQSRLDRIKAAEDLLNRVRSTP